MGVCMNLEQHQPFILSPRLHRHHRTVPHTIMSDSLTNWYLQGTTLHPTPEYLRTHVTALAKNDTSSTLTLTFTDDQTITLSHAQISVSPLSHLKPFTNLKLETTSESFTTIRDFVYCTPVDLSDVTLPLIKAARTWELHELYHACFLVAETAGFGIVQLVETYIPLVTYEHTPKRFKQFVAGRVAVDSPALMAWLSEDANGERGWNKQRFLDMLEKGDMTRDVRKALQLHSEVVDTDILACESTTSRRVINLFWEIPLGELLCSQKEFFECDVCTDGGSGYVEMIWNKQGVRVIVGLQEVEGTGLVNIRCCAIGMSCSCGDSRHNAGWTLEGGAERRSVDWVVSHEVEFWMFDAAGLRDWREIHKNCSVRVKIRVIEDGDNEDGDAEESGREEVDSESE